MPYKNPQYLVETDWLVAHLQDPELRIIEVTGVKQGPDNTAKEICSDKRHIPGAVFLDVASNWGPFNDLNAEFPITWPPQAQFEASMGEIGVGNDSHVVLYASGAVRTRYSCQMWSTRASAEAMKAHFEKADVLTAESVITYCGGGGCASTDSFVLALLGYTSVAMYDNSLYEWGPDPSLPMTDPSSGQDKP